MLKISEVYPFSLVTKSLYYVYYNRLITFDPSFADPFFENEWRPKNTGCSCHNYTCRLAKAKQG